MREAAPQAANGMSADETCQALDALPLLWGHEYKFGFDPEHGWWAIKNGNIGSIITADSPEELNQALADSERPRR